MSLNKLKRYLRQKLPIPVLSGIQKLRKLNYRPPVEFHDREVAFHELQKRVAGPGLIALREGLVLRIDDESREPFEWFGWRSPEMVSELDLFIRLSADAYSFADVGANHGIFSLVFLRLNPQGRAISIDPSPIADRIRLKNRKLNGMETSLISFQVACGSAKGSVKMHYNWHHLEASSKSGSNSEDVEIPVRSLDEICAESGMSPEIIKVDVEGFELEVLKGAEESLAKSRLLFLEIHPERLDELQVPQADIFEWLNSRGWKIETLHGKRLSSVEFNDQIHTFWTICERKA